MLFRLSAVFASVVLLSQCRAPVETEIRHDIKYLAAFASPALLTADDEKRFSTNFQSKYKNRVIILHPITGLAYLAQAGTRASLFALIRVGSLRESRQVTREIEQALGGTTLMFLPLIETTGSQDNFSGQVFYLTLEKRSAAYQRLTGPAKAELWRTEADELGRDRNILSYFAGGILSDTPYQSVHIMGFSGAAESEYQTIEGLYHRAAKKLDAADTVLAEKIR